MASCLDQISMTLLVELHPDIKKLQQDVLRCLIPLDDSIWPKQHHVAYKTSSVRLACMLLHTTLLLLQCSICCKRPEIICNQHLAAGDVAAQCCHLGSLSCNQGTNKWHSNFATSLSGQLTNRGLANKLELLVWPTAGQHLLQFGRGEKQLEVHLGVSVVLLILLQVSSRCSAHKACGYWGAAGCSKDAWVMNWRTM